MEQAEANANQGNKAVFQEIEAEIVELTAAKNGGIDKFLTLLLTPKYWPAT